MMLEDMASIKLGYKSCFPKIRISCSAQFVLGCSMLWAYFCRLSLLGLDIPTTDTPLQHWMLPWLSVISLKSKLTCISLLCPTLTNGTPEGVQNDLRSFYWNIGLLVSCRRLNTNKSIYDSLRSVVENGDVVPTTEEDDHVARLFLFDFEQCGIHLDTAKVS